MLIEIKGREYELKFTINVLCMMADDGIDVLNIDKLLTNINMSTVRDLFYYALKGTNKKITKNQVGEIMDDYIDDGGNLFDLIELIMSALGKSLGNKEEDIVEVEEDIEGEEGK